MQKDMQRLAELAHSKEAQQAISAFIELGGDQTWSAFELGLPDTTLQVWKNEGKPRQVSAPLPIKTSDLCLSKMPMILMNLRRHGQGL
jgi:hypothetical protein